jgi:D-inositol-3-phosphate glycosyltransferase
LTVVPRVALLTGGGDRPYALGLASSLAERDVLLDVIGSDSLDCAALREYGSIRFLNLRGDMDPGASAGQKTLRVLRYYGRLLRYAKRSDARIFHLLWNNRFEHLDRTIVLVYYKLLGKRLAMTVHNVNVAKRDNRDNVFNRMTLRAQYRLVDHLFVHTPLMKEELVRAFNVPPRKISVIPFGVNETVPTTALGRADARKRLGLPEDSPTLLFFGNIAPYKGLEYLVDAVALCAKECPGLRLIVAGRPKGEGAYWDAIKRRIESLGIQSRVVQRIEYVPDEETEVYFKASDALMLPYKQIFQSGVLLLGYGFGLPVLASDVGSLRQDVLEGKTGFVCAPKDAKALASLIRGYLRSDLYSERDQRRDAIRAFAREKYSWGEVARITQEVYERLLDGPDVQKLLM